MIELRPSAYPDQSKALPGYSDSHRGGQDSQVLVRLFAEAAEGTRTLDLLHGNQCVGGPISSMHAGFSAEQTPSGLRPLTVDSDSHTQPGR